LVLRGFLCDTLHDLYEPAIGFEIDASAFNKAQQQNTAMQEWDEASLGFAALVDPYADTCSRKGAFWRTLVVDMIGDGEPQTRLEQRKCSTYGLGMLKHQKGPAVLQSRLSVLCLGLRIIAGFALLRRGIQF
jgi:hypothetical protein